MKEKEVTVAEERTDMWRREKVDTRAWVKKVQACRKTKMHSIANPARGMRAQCC